MFFQPRHFARWRSERVSSTDDAVAAAEASADEEGAFINTARSRTTDQADASAMDIESGNFHSNATRVNNSTNETTEVSDPSAMEEAGNNSAPGTATSVPSPSSERLDDSTESDDEDDNGVAHYAVRHTMSLAELEEERELARRRSSACVLFALFVLFRLWLLALQEGDFGLLLLCLIGSSWTARWIRYNRDQEEELDRRIANYLSNPEGSGGDTQVPRDDLRMLSFQAQLALAIMESQRQMMQGGHGHPDGNGNQTPGVSEAARAKWTQFTYQAARDKEARKGTYGAVSQDATKPGVDEEPHCSICLGEYEDGEQLTTLPCSHTYHNECIASWCSNHIRCPLCNYNLEAEPAGESA